MPKHTKLDSSHKLNLKYHELELIDLNPDKYTSSYVRDSNIYDRLKNWKGMPKDGYPNCVDPTKLKFRIKNGLRIYAAT